MKVFKPPRAAPFATPSHTAKDLRSPGVTHQRLTGGSEGGKKKSRKKLTDGRSDRQTGRQTDKQTDRDGQTHRQAQKAGA